jgi:hypothetical protein
MLQDIHYIVLESLAKNEGKRINLMVETFAWNITLKKIVMKREFLHGKNS